MLVLAGFQVLCSSCVVLVNPSFMFLCVARQRCNVNASTACGDLLKEFDDLSWAEALQPVESTRVRTEDVGQLKETPKKKRIENELMNQNVCNWRDWRVSRGDQKTSMWNLRIQDRPRETTTR